MMKSISCHASSKCHLILFVPWYLQDLIPVPFMCTLSPVSSPMACSHCLFLDSSGGVLRLVQLILLPFTEMEHGLLLAGKLSMIWFSFVRSSSLSFSSSKEYKISTSQEMKPEKLPFRFLSFWRQLYNLCQRIFSIYVDCSIRWQSDAHIASWKSVQGIIRLHVLMKTAFISSSYDMATTWSAKRNLQTEFLQYRDMKSGSHRQKIRYLVKICEVRTGIYFHRSLVFLSLFLINSLRIPYVSLVDFFYLFLDTKEFHIVS